MTWPFEDILEIHRRWFELSDRGLEIFLINGKTCLLAFDSSQVNTLTLYLLVPSADNFCKQIGPRSGPTKCLA